MASLTITIQNQSPLKISANLMSSESQQNYWKFWMLLKRRRLSYNPDYRLIGAPGCFTSSVHLKKVNAKMRSNLQEDLRQLLNLPDLVVQNILDNLIDAGDVKDGDV